jgi:hypothetical protein
VLLRQRVTPHRARASSRRWFLPIFLGAFGAQARKAVPVNRILPGEEFVDREHVAVAGFFKGQQATPHGRDYLRLAPGTPRQGTRRNGKPPCTACRVVGEGCTYPAT